MIHCEGEGCLIKKMCARYSTDLTHFAWVEEMYDVRSASCEMFKIIDNGNKTNTNNNTPTK